MAFFTAKDRTICKTPHVLGPNSPIILFDPATAPNPNFLNLSLDMIKNLFIEGADSEESTQGFTPMLDGSTWTGQTFVHDPKMLEKLILEPHVYIPKIMFSMHPTTALKLGIQWVFQLVYGINDMAEVVARLFKTNLVYFKPFETYFRLVVDMWSKDSIRQTPNSLGPDFMQMLVASRAENQHLTGLKFLHLNKEMRAEVGLNLKNVAPLPSEVASVQISACSRSNPHTALASFYAFQCSCCTLDYDSSGELEAHMAECLANYGITCKGPEENLVFTCQQCATDPMNFEELICHFYCFCTINVRSACVYCNAVSKRCNCAKIRLVQLRNLEILLYNSLEYDLVNKMNAFYLMVWLESAAKQHVYDAGFYDTATFGNTDLHLIVQVGDGELFCMNKTPRGLINTPVNHAIDNIKATGINMAAVKTRLLKPGCDWLKNCPPPVCGLCWRETSNETNHLATTHPSCYCRAEPFMSIDDLIEHFEQHQVKNVTCADCPVKFETLGAMLKHSESHLGVHVIQKAECDSNLGLKLCRQGEIDGWIFLKHLFIYHLDCKETCLALVLESHNVIRGNYSAFDTGTTRPVADIDIAPPPSRLPSRDTCCLRLVVHRPSQTLSQRLFVLMPRMCINVLIKLVWQTICLFPQKICWISISPRYTNVANPGVVFRIRMKLSCGSIC